MWCRHSISVLFPQVYNLLLNSNSTFLLNGYYILNDVEYSQINYYFEFKLVGSVHTENIIYNEFILLHNYNLVHRTLSQHVNEK